MVTLAFRWSERTGLDGAGVWTPSWWQSAARLARGLGTLSAIRLAVWNWAMLGWIRWCAGLWAQGSRRVPSLAGAGTVLVCVITPPLMV